MSCQLHDSADLPQGKKPGTYCLVKWVSLILIWYIFLATEVLVQFNVRGSVHRNNILIYIQQDATLHRLFYLETALHVSGGTITHLQERKQLYLQHLVFVRPLLLPAAIAARGGAAGWGTALPTGRSRVRFPIVSLQFFIAIILPAALWSWVDSVSNRNEYQEYFLEVKAADA